LPPRPEDANKGTFGKVLVVGGSRRFVGAPRLAAEAAYRAGAGLVTVAATPELQALTASALPEVTWILVPADDEGMAREAVLTLRNEWQNFSAAVIGPGMGDRESTAAFTWAGLPDAAEVAQGVVIDADTLNVLAAMPDGPERVPANAIMTPHPGEMARLLGRTIAEVQAERLRAANDCARKYGCVAVLKGAHTAIAGPDGRGALSPFANPLLSSAGSGDVLAGIIAGYLAQGLAPFEAACAGVYVHGAAGEALREEYGEGGLLAHELSDRVPRIVRELKQA
jgi:NAD(P)H-hydrate epimerase